MKTTKRSRAVLAASSLALSAGLAGAVPSAAVPGLPSLPPSLAAAAASDTDVYPTTSDEKYEAARLILEASAINPDWIRLDDRGFVFQIWKIVSAPGSTGHDRVRRAAETALTGQDVEATYFILSGMKDARDADIAQEIIDSKDIETTMALRRSAAAYVNLTLTTDQLLYGEKNFNHLIWERSTGRVKSAAAAADSGTPQDRQAFLETGIRIAWDQDQDDAKKAAEQKSREEQDLLALNIAKRRAGAAIGFTISADDPWLGVPDVNLLREIYNRTAPTPTDEGFPTVRGEVYRAMQPGVDTKKFFLDQSVEKAGTTDFTNWMTKTADANKRRVLEIRTAAANSLVRLALRDAAQAVLDRGDNALVQEFIDFGQYAHFGQSLEAVSPSARNWFVRPGAGNGAVLRPGPLNPTPGAGEDATFDVVDPLASGDNCFSFEAKFKKNPATGERMGGWYLRHKNYVVSLEPSDGSTQFAKDATFCAKPGNNGTGVSFTALSNPDLNLRHYKSSVWVAAPSNVNPWETTVGYNDDTTWQIDPEKPTTTAIKLRFLNDPTAHAAMVAEKPGSPEEIDGDIHHQTYTGLDAYPGHLYWRADTGVRWVLGSIAIEYLRLGGPPNTRLGPPRTDEGRIPTGGRWGPGAFNHFANGSSIYFSYQTQKTIAVYREIFAKWDELRWEQGDLGFPTNSQVTQPNGVLHQDFQGGTIDYNPTTHTYNVTIK